MPGQSFELKSNLLITAGAGAGKTTVLINTLMDVLQSHLEKQIIPRVAVSTFTRKATREIKERMIVKALELNNKHLIQYINYSPHLHISTLHGIFSRFIQTYGHQIGFSPGITVMNEKEEDELFVSILKKMVFEEGTGRTLLEHYSFKEITSIAKQYVLHIQNRPEEALVNEKEMQNIIINKKEKIEKELQIKKNKKKMEALLELQNELAYMDKFQLIGMELKTLGEKILPVWTQKKRELCQITLNDLEIMTMDILKKEKNNLKLIGNKWDFLFLDEHQDTSRIQKNILNKLTQNCRVFKVGDPQQSIYYFRGADVSLFQEEKKTIKNTSYSQVKHLHKNYRACPELVAFFNDFFPKDRFEQMQPVNENYKKEKEVACFILPFEIKADKEEREFEETVKRIHHLLKQGVKPDEIAVLARHNKPLHSLSQYLKKQKLPVYLHSSGNFKHRREIMDALFLLKFLLNPYDDENLIGLLRTPYCRVSDHTLVNIMQKTGKELKVSLWDYLMRANSLKTEGLTKKIKSKQKEGQSSFPSPLLKEEAVDVNIISTEEANIISKLKHHLANTEKTGIIQSFQNAIECLGFIDLSYYQDPMGLREANLWKLIYCLKDFELNGPAVLPFFADYLLYESTQTNQNQTNYSQSAVSATENAGIQLMTIHASKGLEFKHIILIKVCSGFRQAEGFNYLASENKTGRWIVSVKSEKEDKRIQSSFHKKIQEEEKEAMIQEFDRLLYVALTRAKETVTLIGSGKPEANSWPQRFPFFSSLKTGCCQTQNYTYHVK